MKSDDILVTVAAVLFVLAGVWLLMSYSSMTGFASTSTATVNVSITSTADINFTTNNIDWGFGTVDSGKSQATLDSAQGTKTNGTNFTANSAGLILQNIGNVNATVQLASAKTKEDFIGGTSPAYNYNVSNTGAGAKANSCIAGVDQGVWAELNSSAPGTLICNPLSNDASADTVRIDIQLIIPKDSKTGALGDVLTATAAAVS